MIESLLAGGLTGVLGSIFSNVTDIFKARQQNTFTLEQRRLDLEAMDREYAFSEKMKNIDAEMASDIAAAELMGASYAHDAATYSRGHQVAGWAVHALVFVDLVRGLVRPVMTGVLLWVLWDTRLEVEAVLSSVGIERMSPDQALGLYGQLVDAIIFMAVSAGLWWFGTRLKRKEK